MSLTKTSLKGAFWLGLLRFCIKAFSLLKITIVARILTPHDFGLFGMIIIPYGFLEVATEPGMNQALIQTKKDPKKYLTSAWLTFAIRGLVISLILFFSAPVISHFYRSDLTQAIKLIAIAPFIKGLVNPTIILFRKHLQFKKEFWFKALASIIESLSTIILAIKLKTMLALPLGVVFGALAALLLSFLMAKLHLVKTSWQRVKELYRYGRWVTLGTLTAYLNDQGDDFIVSKILGAQSLGLYQTAYKISNLPTTQGASLVYQIVFPIFSSIQNNLKRLKRGVVKSLTLTFFLSLAFGAAIYLIAPIFTRLVLGAKWLPMIPALNILIIFGVARPLISVGAALFDAIGQPQMATTANIIKLTVLLVLIFPFTYQWGIIGTAWAVVISQLLVYPWFIAKLIQVFK